VERFFKKRVDFFKKRVDFFKKRVDFFKTWRFFLSPSFFF